MNKVESSSRAYSLSCVFILDRVGATNGGR